MNSIEEDDDIHNKIIAEILKNVPMAAQNKILWSKHVYHMIS